MKPITDTQTIKTLKSLSPKIGISYNTMDRYIKRGTFSAETCLKIEKITDGSITTSDLRPDLFTPMRAHELLVESCVKNFESHTNDDNYELIIAILNFLESQQPDLYKAMLDDLSDLQNGKAFVAQRLAHKNDG